MTDTVDLLFAPSEPRRTATQTAHTQGAAQAAHIQGAAQAAHIQGAAQAAHIQGAAQAATALGVRLGAAAQAARAGRLDIARSLCARAVLYDQPLLAGSARLLRQAIAALLYCQAFGQLARLLGAVQGRRVRFRAGRMAVGTIAAVAPAGPDEPEVYVLDPTLMAAEDGDRLVRRWAATLAAKPRGNTGLAPAPPRAAARD